MLKVDLSRLFSRQVSEARANIIARLRAGLGYQGEAGEPLKPLARGRGPLGGAGVPRGIVAGRVRILTDGFVLTFDDTVALFHRGRKKAHRGPVKAKRGKNKGQWKARGGVEQPRRPIVGFTREDRAKWQAQAEAEVAAQLTRQIDQGATL